MGDERGERRPVVTNSEPHRKPRTAADPRRYSGASGAGNAAGRTPDYRLSSFRRT
jgi:hypothetical protein